MKTNYAKLMENIIKDIDNHSETPSLLLHSCCAPCSSSVIELLSRYFKVTVFFFNPNITDQDEYNKRLVEQRRFIQDFKTIHPVHLIEGEYSKERFLNFARPLKEEHEGGKRCDHCYGLRMEETAKTASLKGFDFFTTTLSVSPLKNASTINTLGEKLEAYYQVSFLYSDFKKKEGYKRSIELSNTYQLYRQNYCGCEFSK